MCGQWKTEIAAIQTEKGLIAATPSFQEHIVEDEADDGDHHRPGDPLSSIRISHFRPDSKQVGNQA